MRTDTAPSVARPGSLAQPAAFSTLDTDRFGIPIARAEPLTGPDIEPVTASCLEHGARLIVARCSADDFVAIHALEAAGYRLMEIQVHYLGPVVATAGDASIRDAVAADEEGVAAVAAAAFADYGGHYHRDPRLSREDCTEAYVSWARRCVTGELAEHVAVAEHDGEIVGFQAHSRPRPDTGQLLLIGVAPHARGRGVYHALGSHAQRFSHERGCSELLAICHQGNLGSHRVFIGLGLRPARVVATFHGWADDLRAR